MGKTFIDELIEINKRIPRRILKNAKGKFVTSLNQVVSPVFYHVDEIRVFDIDASKMPIPTKPYFLQLGKGDYRGMRHVSKEEVKLALGHDFKTVAEESDILAMLRACEVYEHANAYFIGANMMERDCIRIPVAYLKIPEKVHKNMAINQKSQEFKQLIDRLKNE